MHIPERVVYMYISIGVIIFYHNSNNPITLLLLVAARMSGNMTMTNNKPLMDLIPVVASILVGMAGGAVLVWSTGWAKASNTKERKRRAYAIEEDGVDVCASDEEDRDDDEEVFLVFVVVFHFCLRLHS